MLTLISMTPGASAPAAPDTGVGIETDMAGFFGVLTDLVEVPDDPTETITAKPPEAALDPPDLEKLDEEDQVDPALLAFLTLQNLPLPVALPVPPMTAHPEEPLAAPVSAPEGLADLPASPPTPQVSGMASAATVLELQDITAKPIPPMPEAHRPPRAIAQALMVYQDDATISETPETMPHNGGARESVGRFRLAEAAQITLAPSAPAEPVTTALDMPAQPTFVAAAPPITLGHPQPDKPAVAAPPHQQAATELGRMLKAAGGQMSMKQNSAELTLTPEDLGRIRFDLRHQGDTLIVTLSADRPETLDLMRRHAGDLRAELSAAGYGTATLDFSGSGGSRQSPDQPAQWGQPAEAETQSAPTDAPALSPPLPRVSEGLDLRI